MVNLAANITLLYPELAFDARIDAAARDGFDGVEILFPQVRPAADLRARLDAADLPLVLMNAPPPTDDPAMRGFPADSGQAARFREVMLRTLDFAATVEPGLIHMMTGYATGYAAEMRFVDALIWLCDTAPEQGFTIEPLTPLVQPGYLLNDYEQAAKILDLVDRPNLGLQYDSFHAEMIHGNACAVWQTHGARATHIQLGQAPDRSAPGPGPADFAALFEAVAASGYDGWLSAEYYPQTPRTEDEFRWMELLPRGVPPRARPRQEGD